jgi:hypothetical protein
VRSTSSLAKAKGLAFRVLADPFLPERLLGDRLRLAQVLRKLLGNALKFTERGKFPWRCRSKVPPPCREETAIAPVSISRCGTRASASPRKTGNIFSRPSFRPMPPRRAGTAVRARARHLPEARGAHGRRDSRGEPRRTGVGVQRFPASPGSRPSSALPPERKGETAVGKRRGGGLGCECSPFFTGKGGSFSWWTTTPPIEWCSRGCSGNWVWKRRCGGRAGGAPGAVGESVRRGAPGHAHARHGRNRGGAPPARPHFAGSPAAPSRHRRHGPGHERGPGAPSGAGNRRLPRQARLLQGPGGVAPPGVRPGASLWR